MGPRLVGDFLSVAAEEAMHFALLERKLRKLGSFYGALPAHGGLWDAARATSHDVAARLAVVPMVLEARGLEEVSMSEQVSAFVPIDQLDRVAERAAGEQATGG